MPCYYPIRGYRARRQNIDKQTGRSNGKRSIVFSRLEGYADQEMNVPCGKCVGCLLARASSWAVRAVHEASLYAENSFITLTYDNKFLPNRGLVSVEEVQKFLKRLRKKGPVRYLACGEYGSKNLRPHYHLLTFGYRPANSYSVRQTAGGVVFNSPELEKLWPFGRCEFGSVTAASAGYIARYTSKKLFDTGMPGSEFLVASRKPPLGVPWLSKHYEEIYKQDSVVLGGKKYKPPMTYDRWLEKHVPDLWSKVVAKRKNAFEKETVKSEYDSFRLPIREAVTKGRIRALKRNGV